MRISDWSSDVCTSDLLAKFLHNSLRLTMARMRVLYRSRAQHSEGPRPGSLQTACLHRDTIEESRGPVAMLRSAGIAGRDADGPNRTAETVFRSLFLGPRSEEHTSELQSLMRISYAGLRLKKK